MKKFILYAGAAVVALSFQTVPAFAQTGDDTELKQETITITARKKEEGLLDAPVAVSAFDQRAIENLNIESVDDIARFTSGLSFSKAFGRSTERPVIRGQSNVLAGVQFGVESGTAYFIDGIYYNGSVSSLDPNDLERVEVIKGPQSALYGRNTYAGAINFVTRGGTDEFDAGAKVKFATNESHEAAVFVSGPIVPGLTGRINYRDFKYGGEYTNAVTGTTVGDESTVSYGGVLDWEPTDYFNLRLRVQRNEDRDGTLPIFLQSAADNNCSPGYRSLNYWSLSGSTNTNQYYCGVIRPGQVALNTGPDRDGVPNLVRGVLPTTVFNNFLGIPAPPFINQPFLGRGYALTDGTAFDGLERETTNIMLSGSYEFAGGYEIRLLAGTRDETEKTGYDSDHSSVNLVNTVNFGDEPFFANTGGEEVKDTSIELKLLSPQDKPVRWTVGGYYYDRDEQNFDITFARPRVNTSKITVESQAVFGLVEWDVTPQLTTTFEGRYAEETKTDSSSTVPTAEFENFTPRLTLDYKLDGGRTVYGVLSQGVKPGGLNGSAGASVGQPTYDQETSNNFEIGYKSPLFGGNWALTSALYFTEAKDVQLTTALPNPQGGALTSIATNQGSGEVLGIELDLNGRFNNNWSGGASYAWTDATFTEGCDPDEWTLTSGGGNYNQATNVGTDFSSLFPGAGPASCDISGNRFPLTSEHQASGFVRYEHPLSDDGLFFATANLSYESSKFVQVHNRAETGDATLLGARVGFGRDNWTLSAYGTNILDEDSVTMATRWLMTPYFTFATRNVAPTTANRSAPRAFFGSLRQGPQFGLELKLDF